MGRVHMPQQTIATEPSSADLSKVKRNKHMDKHVIYDSAYEYPDEVLIF